MKGVNLIFVVCTANHLFFINEIKKELDRRGRAHKILCIHFDEWYQLNVESALVNSGFEYSGFERTNKTNKNFWNSGEKIWDETDLTRLDNFFLDLNSRFSTDIFVLFTDDGIFESRLIKLCNSKNIKTLFIQESSRLAEVIGNSFARIFLKNKLKGFKNYIRRRKDDGSVRPFGLNGCKYIAVTNFESYVYFLLNGCKRQNTHICGHLLMDKLRHYKNTLPERRLPATGKKKILIVSSGWINFGFTEYHKWFVSQVKFFVESLKEDYDFLLRLKNGEDIETWKELWTDVDCSFKMQSPLDSLYDQIVAADIIITNNSQTIIEALMLDLPVINLISDNMTERWSLGKNNVILNIRSGSELVKCFRQTDVFTLKDSQKKKATKIFNRYFYSFDGRASERLCDFIETKVLQ